jgi:hypothetical protein
MCFQHPQKTEPFQSPRTPRCTDLNNVLCTCIVLLVHLVQFVATADLVFGGIEKHDWGRSTIGRAVYIEGAGRPTALCKSFQQF